ncbi:MAG: glycosyltransferase family 4 protein [Acidobacteriota bacterium]
MRVLFASRRPAYPFFQGGAERSFFEMAKALAEGGHRSAIYGECRDAPERLEPFLSADGAAEEYSWLDDKDTVLGRQVPSRLALVSRPTERLESLNTFLADFRRQLVNMAYGFRPDVICTQLDGSSEVVELCSFVDAHMLHFVRDTCFPFNFHVLTGVPGSPPTPICVANSRYTADFVRSEFGVESRVLYPTVPGMEPSDGETPASADRDRRRAEGRAGRVLFVNPHRLKGGPVLYEVARRLSDVPFLVIPGWADGVPSDWRRLPNVEWREWPVLDMGAAYRSADLAVVPTQQSEGFGRVAIEAQVCGTPVMASNNSALAEVLGDSALLVDDYRDPEAWAVAIRSALSAPDRLRRLAAAGRVNAARFAPERICRDFEDLVRELDEERG